jgi:hypothetical protein
MIVAPMEILITNLEKDFCWLKAIRFAMKPATLKTSYLSFKFNEGRIFILFFHVNSQYYRDFEVYNSANENFFHYSIRAASGVSFIPGTG